MNFHQQLQSLYIDSTYKDTYIYSPTTTQHLRVSAFEARAEYLSRYNDPQVRKQRVSDLTENVTGAYDMVDSQLRIDRADFFF